MTLNRKRLATIDMAKGIAILLVVLVHYNQSYDPGVAIARFGQMAVQVFFVIAGFNAANSLSRRLLCESFGKASMTFLGKRLAAIAPAWYLAILTAYALNGIASCLSGHTLGYGANPSPLAIAGNLLFLNGLMPFCNNNVVPGGWYVGTLMLMYALTPMLLRLYERFQCPAGVLTAVLSLGAFLALVGVAKLIPSHSQMLLSNNSFGYFSIVAQLPCYLLGMQLSRTAGTGDRAPIRICASVALLALAIYCFFCSNLPYAYLLTVYSVGLSVYFGLQLSIGRELSGSRIYAARLWRFLAKLGKESLYIYLVHVYFAWTFAKWIQGLIIGAGFDGNSLAVYVLLYFVVLVLACIAGVLFRLASRMLSLAAAKSWRGGRDAWKKRVLSKRNGGVRLQGVSLRNCENLECAPDAAFGSGARMFCTKEYLGERFDPVIRIGRGFHATRNLTIQCAGSVDIGDSVLVASDVFIIDFNHGVDPTTDSYLDNPLEVDSVVVEDGVWIGNAAILLPGARIGTKSIVAAGAVVTGLIPPYCIAAGVPARVVKTYDHESGNWK